jgi:hypothetical protein
MGYQLQILDPDGQVALRWPAGGRIERELADAILEQARDSGFGWFGWFYSERTIRKAIASAIRGLKAEVRPTDDTPVGAGPSGRPAKDRREIRVHDAC